MTMLNNVLASKKYGYVKSLGKSSENNLEKKKNREKIPKNYLHK